MRVFHAYEYTTISAPFAEKIIFFFFNWIIFTPLLKSSCPNICRSTSRIYFVSLVVPLVCYSILSPIPQVLDCGFTINLQSDILSLPTLFFFFKVIFPILGPLHFHVSSRIILSISIKNPEGICKGCIKSTDQFEKNWHL